jgi:hypothetical protein
MKFRKPGVLDSSGHGEDEKDKVHVNMEKMRRKRFRWTRRK